MSTRSARAATRTTPAPSNAEVRHSAGVLLRSPWLLLAGFVAVHAWLIQRAIAYHDSIFGDVGLYHWWVANGWATGSWPVLDTEWVYPFGALAPLILADVGPWPYQAGFVALVVLLNALAVAFLVHERGLGTYGAWWWLAFLAVLGPISLGRLDGVIAPLILIAATLGLRHPRAAAVVATVGAWIKIAPAAIFLAVLTFTRRRARVLAMGALVSALVIAIAMAAGSGTRVLSVFGEQGRRALQAEAVLATPYSLARLGSGGQAPEYNREIYTYEFLSPSAHTLAGALDAVLVVAVLAVLALGLWVGRRRPEHQATAFLLTAQAVLVALVVFNKVGSPQFIAWLAPVVAVGLSSSRRERGPWLAPALALLAAGLLTQLIYPVDYGGFIHGEPVMVGVAALRNVIVVIVGVILLAELIRLGRRAPR